MQSRYGTRRHCGLAIRNGNRGLPTKNFSPSNSNEGEKRTTSSRQKSGEVEILVINPFKISDNTRGTKKRYLCP